MILHTTNTTLINTTTPQHPMLQHLKPLCYHNKLYCHHLLTSSRHLCVYRHLRLSVTPIHSAPPIPFLSTLSPITRNPSHDRMSDTESNLEYSPLSQKLFDIHSSTDEYPEVIEPSTTPFDSLPPSPRRTTPVKMAPVGSSSGKDPMFSFSAHVDKKTPVNI